MRLHYFLLLLLVSYKAIAQTEVKSSFRHKLLEKIISSKRSKDELPISTDVKDKIESSGDFSFSLNHKNIIRKYRIHVPKSYQPKSASPLIIALHGGGGDMNYMANDQYYGLISKSEKDGFIVVFPNGFSQFETGILATWNAGGCCGSSRDLKIDDVDFIKEVISTVKVQLNIDSHKIFAIGMSNGGMMSHRLACELPEIFKAIASVAGSDETLECNSKKPISILQIHAKNDDHVLFNGGIGAGFPGVAKDKIPKFNSVTTTITNWLTRNHCEKKSIRVLEVAGAYCEEYTQCSNNVKVKLCVTESGGHSWPGGHKNKNFLSNFDNSQAISANDEIWNFFKFL